MSRKALHEAAPSKLARREGEGSEGPRLVAAKRTPRQPKSFRLGPLEIERFQRIASRLSEEVGRPISDTDILKGLLLLGEKVDTKRLVAAIKDASFSAG